MQFTRLESAVDGLLAQCQLSALHHGWQLRVGDPGDSEMITENGVLRSAWHLGIACAALSLAGCGGGGDSTSVAASAPVVAAPVTQNRAPVVASANATQAATVGVAFQYDATKAGTAFTDADGDTLTYRTTIAPAGGGLAATGATISGTPTTAGAYAVTVTADDGHGGTVSNSFSIQVAAANRVPVVASANTSQTATVGVAFQYDASKAGAAFTDPDGDTLSYRVTIAPTGSGLTAATATVSGTPTTAATYTVTITADDGRGGTVSNSFSVTVQPAPLVPTLPATAFLYADASINLPRQFTAAPGNPAGADNTPIDNAVTNAGATLGRVLFYDKRLSINDTVSCGSCHQQAHGFSDAQRLSIGFQGGLTTRHAMGLANARYYQPGKFFWDERAATAEIQVLQPIQNSVEMGNSLTQLVTKLSAVSFYGPLFTAAFGDSQVTSDRIAKALAQYVRAILSYRAKYDQAFTNGAPNFAATFTAQEEQGRQLFEGVGRCNACHGTVAHISDSAKNNGLDAVITDVGAGGGRFKAPSLRNIAVRPPYMHDGRFTTLRQVIDHYDSGVQDSATLAPGLRAPDGTVKRLNLTETEKLALEAFLGTLTDTALLADPKFSDPFPH